MHQTSLITLIAMAYEFRGSYQYTVPNWMRDQAYSVVANLPSGAKKEQIPAMLKRLLEDRLALSVHTEQRDTDVLALIVDRGGAKLTPCMPPAQEMRLSLDGTALNKRQTPAGGICPSNRAQIQRSFITVETHTMEYLIRCLLDAVDRPVIDHTDLKGDYDIYLSGTTLKLCTPEEHCVPNTNLPPITEGLKKLGLRLEARREKLEHWVVDSANRMPTEQ